MNTKLKLTGVFAVAGLLIGGCSQRAKQAAKDKTTLPTYSKGDSRRNRGMGTDSNSSKYI